MIHIKAVPSFLLHSFLLDAIKSTLDHKNQIAHIIPEEQSDISYMLHYLTRKGNKER